MEMEEEREREARVQVPWIPQTLFMPGLRQSEQICQSMQEDQLEQADWSGSDRRVCVGTLPGLDTIPFGHLLALANAASASSTSAAPPCYGMESTALLNSTSDGCKTESRSAILNPGFSLRLHTWVAEDRIKENPQYGLPTSQQYFYDLNLLPEEMMNMNPQTTAAEFAPITPEKPGREFLETQDSSIVEKTDHERQEPVTDSLLVPRSAEREKNHKTGKRERQDIEQLKTPQQKPKRKKHRPKVITERKPKRQSKLETSKSAEPKQRKSGKGRNVKRKEGNEGLMPFAAEAAAATSDLKRSSRPKRSARRALNFDYDTEQEDEIYTFSLTSDFPELHVPEKLCTDAANDFGIYCVDQVRKDGTSGGGEAPITPMLIFSNIPKRRRRRTPLLEERLVESSKSENPTTNDQADTSRDFLGIQSNSLFMFQTMFWVQFPNIQRKRRTDSGSFAISSASASSTAAKDIVRRELISQHNPYMAPPEPRSDCHCSMLSRVNGASAAFKEPEKGLPHTAQWLTGLAHPTKLRKKRSRTITRARNFDSLKRILEACDGQGSGASHNPQRLEAIISEMQSTVSRKKRSKRNSILSRFSARRLQMQWGFYLQHHLSLSAKSTGTSPDELWKQLISIDAINEWFMQLDINRESPCIPYHGQNALIPHRTRYRERNALVLYRRDGSIVPFGSSFYPVRKQRPRPMVKLDDETTRVWKLLMANINSEGIDGTDEEKEKWWEEERGVFGGRADSFIARMRLVQGDRRFSPWKGSVVDSVIGVFLTQNVSDHLSSSAFMAVAAQFPLKSTSNKRPCHEEWESSLTHEPLMYLEDSGDAVSAPPICNSSCIITHKTSQDEDNDAVFSDETSRACGSFISSTKESKIMWVNSPKNGLETYSNSEAKEMVYYVEDRNEILDPSRHSLLSQDSENFRPAMNVNITRSCSISKTEKEDSSNGARIKSLDAPFTEFSETSQSIIQQRHGSSIMLFDAISVNKPSNLEMGEGDSQIPHIDDQIDSKNSQGTSAVSSRSPNLQFIFNEEVFKVEKFEPFKKKTDEGSQPRSSSQQEEDLLLHAQDQEENRKIKQHINTGNLSREVLDMTESTTSLQNQLNTQKETLESDMKEQIHPSTGNNTMKASASKSKGGTARKEKKGNFDWDSLRRQTESGRRKERMARTMDSVDWEAVRCADVDKIAKTIRARGMNNMLSERIKDFLDRLVREHGSIDLEWLRDIPPDKAKEYLLSIRGLGLKSVECVRLLTLHHLAFPVDTNVGRIAVRLGWVPLQPLPESLQLHLLELYPVLESIQKYLWPRLCKLDQKTLYELHYQMITFGKVFCTKSKPNCNACPMRGECRHFASAFASARLALPGPEEKSIVTAEERRPKPEPVVVNFQQSLFLPQDTDQPQRLQTLEAPNTEVKNSEPIIEEPATPEPECIQVMENDIEDVFCEDPDEIPTIKLNIEAFTQNLQNYIQRNTELQEGDVSKALVALSTEAASIPAPKLKSMSRLRTEHQAYELPDSHPLLEGLDKRGPDDPCSYLLAIWTPGETANSIQPPEKRCVSQENSTLCHEKTCFSCNSIREAKSQIVRGTLLIPCRTAMRGSFPLNGTYFQVNEVFADHDSSLNPIDVPRDWIWNLPRRTVYFGTSIPTIFRGLTTEAIQHCFWRGYVCVRGFDRKTRAPRPLMARLHFPASKLGKRKGRTNQDEGYS